MGLANDAAASLVLAHAWYFVPMSIPGESPFPGEMIQQMVDDEAKGLAEAAQAATALGATRVETTFLTGHPWTRLVETVERDRGFELVVLGTHGRTGLGRILLGSVAEQVVRHAPCSVLVARGDAVRFKQILCLVDFSDEARTAVDAAARLAATMAAELTLAHIVEIPITFSGNPSIGDFVSDLERRSAKLLDEWAAELRGKITTPVTTQTRVGSAAAATLALLAGDRSFDLAVVGSPGRTGLRRVLLGSVAESIVRHAPCSVLVARTRHG